MLPNPSWFGNNTAHAYDHAALDVTNGIYYYFPFGGGNSRGLHRYDTTANTWLADTPAAPYTDCCAGVEYFPEFVGSNASAAPAAWCWPAAATCMCIAPRPGAGAAP